MRSDLWEGAWPSLEVVNLGRAIQEVRKLVREPPPGLPDEVTRALARFLVVRSSGYLEQIVRRSCLAYLSSKSDQRAGAYAAQTFPAYLNPTPERLTNIVQKFDVIWSEELSDLFDEDDEYLRREIGFLVDRRSKIAHGLSEGVTSTKALSLFEAAEQIAAWFVLRFDPR